MRKRDLVQYGLKWNPFSPDVPPEALMPTAKSDVFYWRVERQLQEGGFVLVTGEPGTGKSVLLRQLIHHLASIPDVVVGVVTRPQSMVGDFYREMGQLFGVPLSPANRYGAFKSLRERWQAHMEATLCRPILIFDEAQLAHHTVLSELRLLVSTQFDATSILTVVLCGNDQLLQRLRMEELLPLESRVRFRMTMEAVPPDHLTKFVEHCLDQAGNPGLITKSVINSLAEHAGGNYRTLINLANDLLEAASRHNVSIIDEKLYFEMANNLFGIPTARPPKRPIRSKSN